VVSGERLRRREHQPLAQGVCIEVSGRPGLPVRRVARHDLDALWAPEAITEPADHSLLGAPTPEADPPAEAPRSNRGRKSRRDPFAEYDPE
jgi:hypothetical protein